MVDTFIVIQYYIFNPKNIITIAQRTNVCYNGFKHTFATEYITKGAGVVEKGENKSYIKILEQFLDICNEKDMAEIYEKAAAEVVDYLEKSN